MEDSLTARELERSMLEAAGYDVRTAVDGVDGLNKLGQHSFDLIVTDIQMPRMDGFAMLGRLKTDDRYRNIPVIIVTTRADESDRKRGLELGADAYLVKGALNDDTLIECTRRLIG
ncbi:MAG: response regulator [Planctomycetes bacterium]|nr:response regulator [Planctomycetota bacterium]